jgi:AmmeMemoRadiSam system protein A
MGSFSKEEENMLLARARAAIEDVLYGNPTPDPEDLSPALKSSRGCFVTLHRRGRLRGCIGTIEPREPLYDAVTRNARNAAFGDPRFPSVEISELADIEIEVSVLTVPRRLEFSTPDDLKQQLKPEIHGVILSRGGRSAVFLPQVWKQLPETERFLENLCLKCGLSKDAWRQSGTQVSVYEAEYFSET